MSRLLPVRVDNKINFHKAYVYIFALLTMVTIVRSLIHTFVPDGGANTIASIIIFKGSPDPNKVIHMIFSLWGLAQLLMGVFYVIVLFRYRALVPLMFLFLTIEYSMRIIIEGALKPLSEIYFQKTTPGTVGNFVIFPLALILFVLTLVESRKKESI